MSDIHQLVAEIERGPQGPSVGAFFDFDGTIIHGYSAAVAFRERIKRRTIGAKELLKIFAEAINVERRGHDVSALMELGVQSHADQSEADFNAFCRDIFESKISGLIYPDVRVLIDAHRDAGHTIAIASSATRGQLAPAAADLGVDHILCTEMEIANGRVTGELAGPIRWGGEKAQAVLDFAALYDLDLTTSYAYSNGAEDVPFLSVVGRPTALNPDKELAELADQRGWPAARFRLPHRHNPITLARSAAALGAIGVGVMTGAGAGILNQNKAIGLEVAASVGSELALSAAGIRLNVHGEHNLWAQRPAVFLFNHQSQLDVVALGALLRRDFTAVAKKELEKDPVFAPIGYLLDVAYIDRGNRTSAVETLDEAAQVIRDGKSVAIAPEGTRSPTPRLLPFKKGPFRLAMAAGVPVVPIIMRNAGELMRPHSFVISNGTLDVAVLDPISTADWDHDNLDEHITRVRHLYLDTMAHWPTEVHN